MKAKDEKDEIKLGVWWFTIRLQRLIRFDGSDFGKKIKWVKLKKYWNLWWTFTMLIHFIHFG
jgi:hypothetical protein